jgi:hypothetical protein
MGRTYKGRKNLKGIWIQSVTIEDSNVKNDGKIKLKSYALN